MKCALLAVIALTSCSTTTSAGRFVTDVTIASDQLVVVDCDITKTVHYDLWGNSASTDAESCSTNRWTLQGAPGRCGPASDAWRALWARGTPTIDERRRLWSSFSPACREALAGGAS